MPEPKGSSARLASLTQAARWSWIAWLYGLQLAAALVFISYFGLPFSQVAIPLGLLGFGTLHALLCRKLERAFPVSHQHFWVPALVYALFIFAMSSRSYSIQSPPSFNTNLFHPLEYAVLAIFFCEAGYPVLLKAGVMPFLLRVVLGGVLYGASDEIHQAFVAGRTASGVDLMLDLVGVILGCGIFLTVRWGQRVLLDRLDSSMLRDRP